MNVRGIQRNMKNVVKNYSDAQVKVREATSNDPWGPPSTLMSEIADLTYNVVAFSEIMQMIWKRLNDHGKNWRHVYKALVLLEYLIKTGSEKVAQQCKENIFAIQTLKDFQHMEENKDQGMNVREKSKGLVALLKDDEKLRNERTRALKAKERFAQSISYASDSHSMETIPKTSMSYHESLGGSGGQTAEQKLAHDLESARPQTLGEEELQLQLALAMSKEEAEAEEKLRKNDDLRLQLALSESQKARLEAQRESKRSAVDDLLSLNPTGGAASDPWGAPLNGASGGLIGAVGGVSADPWSSPKPPPIPDVTSDPWNPQAARSSSASNDPWQPSPPPAQPMDPWAPCDNSRPHSEVDGLGAGPSIHGSLSPVSQAHTGIRKTPESFLGPNSNLVNLDALVSKASSGVPAGNPFAGSTLGTAVAANPFQAAKPAAPTINQLRSQGTFPSGVAPPMLTPTPFGAAGDNLMGAGVGLSGGITAPGSMGISSANSNPFSL